MQLIPIPSQSLTRLDGVPPSTQIIIRVAKVLTKSQASIIIAAIISSSSLL